SLTTGSTLGSATVTVTLDDHDCANNTSNFTFTVTTTNSLPRLDFNTPLSIDQGATATIDSSKLHAFDLESPASGLTYTIGAGSIGGAPHNGTLKKSGVALASGAPFTQDDIGN